MNNEIQFLLYNAPNGEGKVQVAIRDETLWMTQQAMASLFGTDRSVITKHLGNIFKSLELERDSVCAIFAHTAADGKTYRVLFYNLDAIISVGYRVNSAKIYHRGAVGNSPMLRNGYARDVRAFALSEDLEV